MPHAKTPVGVLGATGVVGQRLLSLLEAHPWFEPVWLAASDRSRGAIYGEAVRWHLAAPLPAAVAALVLQPAAPEGCPARLVFSALDSGPAAELEPRFAAAGHLVISNASALRMRPDVPLLIPEVNPEHLALLRQQREYVHRGGVVTNPNCSTVGLAMALAPLERAFGVEQVFVTTLQAISGAGYPGVASLDILANVVPYIAGEEEKLETESGKILGALQSQGGIVPANIAISAQCNRVPVLEGHTEAVAVKLRRHAPLAEVRDALARFRGRPQELKLPTAPASPLRISGGTDRPQPQRDVEAGGGMTVTVGRLRPCRLLDYKFVVLSHNTLRGAAGAALLNAELIHAEGW